MSLTAPPTEKAASAGKSTYRHDLDGLRGVAIALVVIYHVFVGRVSGGVDVFLLLSGYFFLGSQLRYASRPDASLNPWQPVWRVMRRLIPSLTVVLGATVLAVYTLTPQLLSANFFAQVRGATTYTLNNTLIEQGQAYSAASQSTSPLQHLWSMSVQGQFYVVAITFGLLMAALVRSKVVKTSHVRRVAGPILIVVTIASFAYANRFGLIGTPDSYYSLFSRAWELTLGAVLALYAPGLRIPQKIAGPMATVGLIMLAITGMVIADTFAFPGVAALLPIGGAMLIILAGGQGVTGRALASGRARWLGSIAYALYLWHWPLLILTTVMLDRSHLSILQGIGVIVVSLILADLTHRFIEEPLKQHAKRPGRDDYPMTEAHKTLTTVQGRARALAGFAVAAGLVGLYVTPSTWDNKVAAATDTPPQGEEYPGAAALSGTEVPKAEPKPPPAMVSDSMSLAGKARCMILMDAPSDAMPDSNNCVFGDTKASKTVVLVGGSHAEIYSDVLDQLGKEHGFKLVPLLRQACPIIIGDNYGVVHGCPEWSELAVSTIESMHPDLVISNSTRPTDTDGHGPDIVPEGYSAFWDRLKASNIKFIGLRDNPWMFDSQGKKFEPGECLASKKGNCDMPRDHFYAQTDPADSYISKYKNAQFVDTSSWYCTDKTCPSLIGNVVVYRDDNHISPAYVSTLGPLMWPHIQKQLGR